MTMMNCSLRRFIRSNRANLFMGGDRLLVMGAGCLALVLVVLQNIYTAVIGVVLFLVMLLITRLMAKNDAQLRPVVSPLREVSALLPRRWRQVSTQTVSLSSRSLTRAFFFCFYE
ncbi:VirB3 family type IV secretion system protein [Vibrio parahaemolyticus]|uniref:VirB3 family type IV secretion system protein n=1 Tax=Vibrio parahaemolyticus TaxID=670 RepID=UPI00214B38CD|nr:VirB3 family type IV secretion system protein [Vibrio parahaemolyticus]